jgi:hypothetical protein
MFARPEELCVGASKIPKVWSPEIPLKHRSWCMLRVVDLHCSSVVHEFGVWEDCGVF